MSYSKTSVALDVTIAYSILGNSVTISVLFKIKFIHLNVNCNSDLKINVTNETTNYRVLNLFNTLIS